MKRHGDTSARAHRSGSEHIPQHEGGRMKSIANVFQRSALSAPPRPRSAGVASSARRSFLRAACSVCAIGLAALLMPVDSAYAKKPPKEKWVASWSASTTVFGVGSPVAQPDLTFPFPTAATDGVVDQTIRMVIKPDLWGDTMRFRFSNVFGDRPVTLSSVSVGLQAYAGNPQQDTLTRVTFNKQNLVTIPKG